jgi:hypothetical protein
LGSPSIPHRHGFCQAQFEQQPDGGLDGAEAGGFGRVEIPQEAFMAVLKSGD